MDYINNNHVYANSFYQSYPPTATAQQSPALSSDSQTYQYYYDKVYQQSPTPTTSVSSVSQPSLNCTTVAHAIGSPVALSPPSSNSSNSNMTGMSTQRSPQPVQQQNLAQTQTPLLLQQQASHTLSSSSGNNSQNAQQQHQQTTPPQLNTENRSIPECLSNGYYNPTNTSHNNPYHQHPYGYQATNNAYNKSPVHNGLAQNTYHSPQPVASPISTANTPPISNNRQQQQPVTSNASVSPVVQQHTTPSQQRSPPHLVASHQIAQQTENNITVTSQASLSVVASPQQSPASVVQQTHLPGHGPQHIPVHNQYQNQTVYQQQALTHPTPPPSVQPSSFPVMVKYENNNSNPNAYNTVYSQDSIGNQWTNGNINNISNNSYHSLQPMHSPSQQQVQYEDVKPFQTIAYNSHVPGHNNDNQIVMNGQLNNHHQNIYQLQHHPSHQVHPHQQQQLSQQHPQQYLFRVQQLQQQHPQAQHSQRPPVQIVHNNAIQTPSATKKRSRAKGKEKSKRDSKKNPNEPSKPISAYALFFRYTQASIKENKPDITFGEISKIVASQWERLNPEQKQVYKEQTDVMRREYLKNMAVQQASAVSGEVQMTSCA